MDDDRRLGREGAAWREARQGCPDPDLLAARGSELLDPAIRETLTAHVRACAACAQLAADLDRVAADVSLESAETRVLMRVRQQAASAQPWRWRLAAAAAVLLACAAAVVWVTRSPSTSTMTGAAGVVATSGGPEAPPPHMSGTLQEHVDVAANWTIEAAPVRVPLSSLGTSRSGEATSAGTTLGDALAPYQEGRYAEAIPLLEAVAQREPGSVDAAFYLGVARLLAQHAADAVAPLERAAALAPRGRRAEIAWYEATAEQRSGKTEAARTRLEALCAAASEYRARACAAAQALR
jgi:tetratricopeptide (TPR) repeat protein